MPETSVHLDIREVTKAFGGTQALDDVSISIATGSVHALVGENGAGKSTLAKIIAGVIPMDRGSLVLRGTPVSFNSPRAALERGIAIVAQELALVPQLTVAQNVFLGVEPRRAGFLRDGALEDRFRALTERAGFFLPADVPAGRLPLAGQQQVEILRALARDAELIVLDEPTAALSGPEAEQLHAIVRSLVRDGRTVVLVSHFLREVLELSDAVSILRDGKLVRTGPAAAETETTLIAGMLGRAFSRSFPEKRPPAEGAETVLSVKDLHAPGVHGVSLEVRKGEIVVLAGLIGAGRSELARAIYGAAGVESGDVLLGPGGAADDAGSPGDANSAGGTGGTSGGRFKAHSPAASLRRGVAFIPESRKDDGLLMGRPVVENVSIASLPALQRLGFVRRRTEQRQVADVMERVAARARQSAPVVTLSGGNQQKVVFARALLSRPQLLIADEPTRGVDVGAKRSIYELIVGLAAEGVGVLLISSEVEEVLGLAHRVLVMRGGRIVAELTGSTMSEENILAAAFATLEHRGAAA